MVVPTTTTLTPGIVVLSSEDVTLPVMVRSWAVALSDTRANSNANSVSVFLIEFDFG